MPVCLSLSLSNDLQVETDGYSYAQAGRKRYSQIMLEIEVGQGTIDSLIWYFLAK